MFSLIGENGVVNSKILAQEPFSKLSEEQLGCCKTLIKFENLEPRNFNQALTHSPLVKEIRKRIRKIMKQKGYLLQVMTQKGKPDMDKFVLYVMKLLRNAWFTSTKFVFDMSILPHVEQSCIPNAYLSVDRNKKSVQIVSLVPILPNQNIRISFYEKLCDDYIFRADLLQRHRDIVCCCSFCLIQKIDEEKVKRGTIKPDQSY